MQDGAWGMSTGLIYVPGTYAKTEELIEIAKVVSKYHGIYASHIRNESTNLLAAVDEALRIGKEAELPVHISHFKSTGRDAWGACPKSGEANRICPRTRANRDRGSISLYRFEHIAGCHDHSQLGAGWRKERAHQTIGRSQTLRPNYTNDDQQFREARRRNFDPHCALRPETRLGREESGGNCKGRTKKRPRKSVWKSLVMEEPPLSILAWMKQTCGT